MFDVCSHSHHKVEFFHRYQTGLCSRLNFWNLPQSTCVVQVPVLRQQNVQYIIIAKRALR